MEDLIIKHRGWGISKKIIGVFWILLAIAGLLFFSDKPLALATWLRSACFVLIGVSCFTPLTGNNKTRFATGDGFLKIKWMTKTRDILIMDNEIEKITLRNMIITIQRKGKKAVVLPFERLKLEDKTKVYQFMIDYARQKNIPLEK